MAQAGDMNADCIDNDRLWEAVERRDAASDGHFYFGVLTTGVYCRPSCPSRHPLRSNVRFYRTPEEAARDGLRPCLRCRPLEDRAGMDARIREICREIEARPEETHDLAALAARAGLSRFHLQRSFKSAVGLSPKQYLEACRVRKLKQSLRESRDVAGAVYDAGYGSSSRVYERADTRLGMTPAQYRHGGRGVAITWAAVDSPLGLMMIGATDRGLCSVQFGASENALLRSLRREYPEAGLQPMATPRPPEFQQWIDALVRHLEGTQPRLDLPLDIQATAFQMRVWNYLQSIPYGEVQSYSEVAAGIGQPTAVRAVARACATNRVAIAIPCHRVIRGTGELGGYRWGMARKRALIDLERRGASQASRQ
jgi:AraC family transcriptional regulator of adaptative response/methylated-DNA-[protein]-cysteine methyltransferase